MDFLIPKICAISVSIIFFVGFLQKISDLEMFKISVEAYDLLPSWATKPTSYGIVSMEGMAALLLLNDGTLKVGGVFAIALLSIVTAAVATNLLRGKDDIGCGCGGIEDEQKISWALVLRNLFLIGLLVPVFFETSLRKATLVDQVTLFCAGLAIYGLYALASQIITNAPRLRGLE